MLRYIYSVMLASARPTPHKLGLGSAKKSLKTVIFY